MVLGFTRYVWFVDSIRFASLPWHVVMVWITPNTWHADVGWILVHIKWHADAVWISLFRFDTLVFSWITFFRGTLVAFWFWYLILPWLTTAIWVIWTSVVRCILVGLLGSWHAIVSWVSYSHWHDVFTGLLLWVTRCEYSGLLLLGSTLAFDGFLFLVN